MSEKERKCETNSNNSHTKNIRRGYSAAKSTSADCKRCTEKEMRTGEKEERSRRKETVERQCQAAGEGPFNYNPESCKSPLPDRAALNPGGNSPAQPMVSMYIVV